MPRKISKRKAIQAAKRKAVASDLGGFEWGRWRFARFGEQVLINQVLMQTWKK